MPLNCDSKQKSENVKVFIRIRPSRPNEPQSALFQIDDRSIELTKSNETKLFYFNRIFGPEARQLDLYKIVAAPLVDRALNGYNGTIFAYGQSGTGKTFTILGDIKDVDLRGIVPNIFGHILTEISLADPKTSYLLTITFLEIYNEEVRDLLNDTREKLEVRETPELGVYVKNLSGITVESTEQVFDIINEGNKRRMFGSTTLNKESSRSHAIFSVRIEAKHEDGSTTFGKLNLVDLAGSERVSKSLATGNRLKEAVKINLSLSVLGNVISALVDGSSTHIPYRNSKLTRLLQDSLGGNCLTSMIATISSSKTNFDETYYTLMYADRAKKIENNVKKNRVNQSVLKTFEIKLENLQKQLEELERNPKPLKKLSRKSRKLMQVEQEKQLILDKIGNLQKKILVGGENLFEKAQLQWDLLDFSTKQLKLLDSSHQLLRETLENKKTETSFIERNSISLQEEDQLLDFQIKEAERKIFKAEKLLFNQEAEYQNEICNLLFTNKCLAKDLALAKHVVNKSIPKQELVKIKNNLFWDDDIQDYRLNSIAHCGNNLKKISLNVGKGIAAKPTMRNAFRKYPKECVQNPFR